MRRNPRNACETLWSTWKDDKEKESKRQKGQVPKWITLITRIFTSFQHQTCNALAPMDNADLREWVYRVAWYAWNETEPDFWSDFKAIVESKLKLKAEACLPPQNARPPIHKVSGNNPPAERTDNRLAEPWNKK